MGENVPELPHFGSIFILLLNVIEDLIVSKDLFILVIINGAEDLNWSAWPWSLASSSSMAWTMQAWNH